MLPQYDVAIVGAGAAGMLAAARAAQRGRRVVVLEKNSKPGVKILMSGGTRCNLTHATDERGIVEAFGKQGRFLHSALAALSPDQLVGLFHAAGVPTKVEPTGKIFPESDSAVDVLQALKDMLLQGGADLRLGSAVRSISFHDGTFHLALARGRIAAEKIILTTGGQSYPECGTTGDGYAWAKHFGHKIVPTRPALVPLRSECGWATELRGVTVPDVHIKIFATFNGEIEKKPAAERRGSFLFTHFGLSGPAVMDASRAVTERPDATAWIARCSFLPGMHQEQLLAEIAASPGNRPVASVIAKWLPKRLVDALLAEATVPTDRVVAELRKAERNRLVATLLQQTIPISGSMGFKKAEVTAGGVALSEIDSSTMQSKLQPGLFFAGEILDLDGPIGGYNFQAAFSTGWLAGEEV